MNQSQLARMAGITPSAISQMEAGLSKKPSSENLLPLAKALHIRAEYLVSGIRDGRDIDLGNQIKARRIELERKDSLDNEAVTSLPAAAKACGIPTLRYAMIEKGEAHATLEELESIANAYRMDLQDIVGNTGPALKPLDIVALDHFRALEKIARGKVAIPVYENIEVSAGPGTIIDDECPTDMLWLEKKWLRQIVHVTPDEMVIVKVRGDSMEPTLSPGDMILIDRQPVDRARMVDGIYVIHREGQTHVKRLQIVADGIKIISDNRALYDPEIISNGMQVVGKVIFAWRGKKF